MEKNYSICVGAVGFGGGVWHSPDGERTGTESETRSLWGARSGLWYPTPMIPPVSWQDQITASIAVKTGERPGRSYGRPWMACSSGQSP